MARHMRAILLMGAVFLFLLPVPLSPAAVKALAEADINSADYLIKCLHCQKAYPGLQALRDHIEAEHPRNLSPNEALSPVHGSYSPAPVPVHGGLHQCAQCSVTFSTKDQLEKHELLHSPNAQVVSPISSPVIGTRCGARDQVRRAPEGGH